MTASVWGCNINRYFQIFIFLGPVALRPTGGVQSPFTFNKITEYDFFVFDSIIKFI